MIITFLKENLAEDFEFIEKENNFIIKKKEFIFKEFEDLYLQKDKKFSFDNFFKLNDKEISISPLILTPNFYDIFTNNNKSNEFTIFITKERLKLMKSINDFINSNEKKYFWLMGNNGIGKTITLLLISILTHKTYKFVYFNTKLFSFDSNNIKFKQLFYNEIYKIYFIDNFVINNIKSIQNVFNFIINRFEKEKRKNRFLF